MLFLYTWLTARNIWLWVIPLFIGIWGAISAGAGPGFIEFLALHYGARYYRRVRGLS
jgi:hypothetical protein